MSNFSIFCPLGQKKSLRVGSDSTRVKPGSASYLLQVKSKLGSGQGPSLVPSNVTPFLYHSVLTNSNGFRFQASKKPNQRRIRPQITPSVLKLESWNFAWGLLILIPKELQKEFLELCLGLRCSFFLSSHFDTFE